MLSPSLNTYLLLKMGLVAIKTFLQRFENNKAPDQHAHSRSLISAFVILFLESFICKLATGEISII